jgi:hypothetical protein
MTALVNDASGETIAITDLQGTVSVHGQGEGSALARFARAATLPLVIVNAAFITVVLDLLRRLFRSLERRESFSKSTVALVHKIGVTIIVFTLLSDAARTWHDHAVVVYLGRHATVQEAGLAFTSATANATVLKFGSKQIGIHVSWSGIMAGLLVLSLGEVFREGLALKEENELTI